jgi:hypothetical protein
MTDVIVKATEIKRKLKFALFIGQRLTKAPTDNLAVVSDLFPIKQDLNWKTEFEFLNVAGLISGDNNQKEFYAAKIYFFDVKGNLLGLRTIQMENVGRKTLKLSELLTDELVSAKTFAIFHPNVSNRFNMAGSFLAERGYSGYEYRNLGVKGYVHGNLDAVALTKGKVKPIGKSGLIPRFYTVQHALTGPSTYEFIFTNPSARKIKITPSISHSPNIWSKAESFEILSLGTHTYTIGIKTTERSYVRFKSRLYMARPVVFRI